MNQVVHDEVNKLNQIKGFSLWSNIRVCALIAHGPYVMLFSHCKLFSTFFSVDRFNITPSKCIHLHDQIRKLTQPRFVFVWATRPRTIKIIFVTFHHLYSFPSIRITIILFFGHTGLLSNGATKQHNTINKLRYVDFATKSNIVVILYHGLSYVEK